VSGHDRRALPGQTGASPILRGLDQGFPALLGYNGTTAKPAANTVLVSDRDDPVLAQWQYGLGRSVAWTSDATGRWAKGWLGWDGFNRFFSQAVAWTFPGEEAGGIDASFVSRGSASTLRVESVDADGSPRDFYDTRATVVGPDFDPREVDLVQVAPGVYEAPLGELDSGAYALRITQTRPGSTALGRTLGLVAPTAAEYRRLGTDEALLAALRAATGGVVIAAAAEAWLHDLRSTTSLTELWPLLLVLALLWPLDIALRRCRSVGASSPGRGPGSVASGDGVTRRRPGRPRRRASSPRAIDRARLPDWPCSSATTGRRPTAGGPGDRTPRLRWRRGTGPLRRPSAPLPPSPTPGPVAPGRRSPGPPPRARRTRRWTACSRRSAGRGSAEGVRGGRPPVLGSRRAPPRARRAPLSRPPAGGRRASSSRSRGSSWRSPAAHPRPSSDRRRRRRPTSPASRRRSRSRA
jgi:hypothetical protein